MSGLVEFLTACIDEDEAWAHDSASPLYSDGEPGAPGHSARVLREVEAKRRIVERHKPDSEGFHVCHDLLADDSDCIELRALASIYADRPGFRDEWLD